MELQSHANTSLNQNSNTFYNFAKIKQELGDGHNNSEQSLATLEPASKTSNSLAPHRNFLYCEEVRNTAVGGQKLYSDESNSSFEIDTDPFKLNTGGEINLNIKKEILESHADNNEISNVFDELNTNNTSIDLNSTNDNERLCGTIISEIIENSSVNDNLNCSTTKITKLKKEFKETGRHHNLNDHTEESKQKNNKLVENLSSTSYSGNVDVLNTNDKRTTELPLTKDKENFSGTIKCELIENSSYSEIDSNVNLNVLNANIAEQRSKFKETEIEHNFICHHQKCQHKENKFVKNPFAFLKRNSEKDRSLKDSTKYYSVKTEIKSEPELSNESLYTTKTKLTSKETVQNQDFILEDDTKQTSIHLTELSIKSEHLYISANDQEVFEESNSRNNIDDESISSLNVNVDSLSNAEIDFEAEQPFQIIKDNEQNNNLLFDNNNNESSVYYSIVEISSAEEEEVRPTTKSNKKQELFRKPYKIRQNQRIPKPKERNKNLNKPVDKTSKRARKPKNQKSSKYSKKDYAFVSKSKKSIKNLPKSTIKTRNKKNNKDNINKKCGTSTSYNTEFPKPLKIENITQKELSIAKDLPKPIILKCESGINIKNIKLFQQPAFQPLVRLKRLKTEELLIPLKMKKLRKTREQNISYSAKRVNNFHTSNGVDSKKDLLIQQAFSLNPSFKSNQIVSGHDNFYDNNEYDQPSLHSRITTPFSLPHDNISDHFNDSASKCFSQQELSALFYSPTPERVSVLSGNLDSGVSTSTPTTFHCHEDNRTLLLKIAAERAFINNHLREFGYSPIQFQLFNNSNELNIFLKYLIDQTNIN